MKNRLTILSILFLCILFLVIGFISCGDAASDLSMYRGIDYIANYKFNPSVGFGSGMWFFDDIVENGHHYMGFNSDASGAADIPIGITTSGLPSGAEGDISRLEIFNLVNDGGFESSPSLTNWTVSGATRTREDGSPSVHNTSGNYSLHYVFNTTPPPDPEYVKFDLGSVKDSFLVDNKYIILLNFSRERLFSPTRFRFNDEREWNVISQTDWLTGSTKFPDAYSDNSEVVADSSSNSFYILYDNFNKEGYIDDFRIIRSSNIDYYIKFTVPYSEAGRPNLYSGTYRFSAYFKAEEAADVSPNKDRFYSSRVSLGIGKTQSTATPKGFDSSLLSSGSWRKLSIEKFIQIRDGDSLILLISSADRTGGSTTLDIGSILVAFPELYYISE